MTTSSLSPGDIVLIRFPFSNLEQTKKRPGLVLTTTFVSRDSSLVTIAMVTSKLDGIEIDGDVKIKDWEDAKLLHPSLVRLSKIATLDSELVEKKLGKLSTRDQKEIQKSMQRVFRAWLA